MARFLGWAKRFWKGLTELFNVQSLWGLFTSGGAVTGLAAYLAHFVPVIRLFAPLSYLFVVLFAALFFALIALVIAAYQRLRRGTVSFVAADQLDAFEAKLEGRLAATSESIREDARAAIEAAFTQREPALLQALNVSLAPFHQNLLERLKKADKRFVEMERFLQPLRREKRREMAQQAVGALRFFATPTAHDPHALPRRTTFKGTNHPLMDNLRELGYTENDQVAQDAEQEIRGREEYRTLRADEQPQWESVTAKLNFHVTKARLEALANHIAQKEGI